MAFLASIAYIIFFMTFTTLNLSDGSYDINDMLSYMALMTVNFSDGIFDIQSFSEDIDNIQFFRWPLCPRR